MFTLVTHCSRLISFDSLFASNFRCFKIVGDFRGLLIYPRPRMFFTALSPPRPVPVGEYKSCPRPAPNFGEKSGTNLENPCGQIAVPALSPPRISGQGRGFPVGP